MILIPRWKARPEIEPVQQPRDLDAGHAGAWVPHGYGAPPTVEIPPDWAMLRPPAGTEQERRFADLMVPVRIVLIVLLWATSSRGRAALAAVAVVFLMILVK